MTTAHHTPGAWKAVYSEYGEEIWFGGNDGPGMWEIEGAEAYLPGDHDEQARLIAAAPDLLAALDAIVAKAHEYGGRSDTPDNVACGFYDIIEDARAAISKATGQPAP